MLRIAIIVLAILFLCGVPAVGVPLAICAIVGATLSLVFSIVKSIIQ